MGLWIGVGVVGVFGTKKLRERLVNFLKKKESKMGRRREKDGDGVEREWSGNIRIPKSKRIARARRDLSSNMYGICMFVV